MRKALLAVILMSLVAAIAAVPNPALAHEAPAAAEDPQAVLAALDSKWEEAYASGDQERIAAVYTEDAVLLPPNHPIVDGRADIGAYLGGMMASGAAISLEHRELEVHGDIALRTLTYEIRADGQVVDTGKALEVWKKVDGEWLLHRDAFNSSVPLATE